MDMLLKNKTSCQLFEHLRIFIWGVLCCLISTPVYAADPLPSIACVNTLSIPFTGGVGVNSNRHAMISPDGQYVVFESNRDNPGNMTANLYSVPIRGGKIKKISNNVRPYTHISRAEISKDSQHVIYAIQRPGYIGIYSTPIRGGDIKLIDSKTESSPTITFRLSEDSQKVVYYIDTELRSASISDGNGIVTLSPASVSASQSAFEISPDGSTVAFKGYSTITSSRSSVYLVAINGGIEPIVIPISSRPCRFIFSADSNKLVFLLEGNFSSFAQLQSVIISNGTVTTTDLYNSGGTNDYEVHRFSISRDSNRVVFISTNDSDMTEISSTPITSSQIVKLDDIEVDEEHRNLGTFRITPDSNMVVYSDGTSLYSIAITGGTSNLLNETVPMNPDLPQTYAINTGGTSVYYTAGRNLYVVPVAGGSIEKLNHSIPSPEGVSSWGEISAVDSVVYSISENVLDWEYDYPEDLFVVSNTDNSVTSLTQNLFSAGTLFRTIYSAESTYAIFHWEYGVDKIGIYSIDLNNLNNQICLESTYVPSEITPPPDEPDGSGGIMGAIFILLD